MLKRFSVAAIIILMTSACLSAELSKFGHFEGNLDLRMEGARKGRLLAPYIFIDPAGKKWEAPEGWVVDGASIPWPLWSIIGSPWTGEYRNASVVHDYNCDVKTEPWASVHMMFYLAMLANGVDPLLAKIMYIAVYRFGPRWDFDYRPHCPSCLTVPYHVDAFMPPFDQNELDSLTSRLKSGELSIDQARGEADRAVVKQLQDLGLGTPVP